MSKKKKAPRLAPLKARPRPVPAAVLAGWEGASAVRFADAGEVLERLAGVVQERDRLGAHQDELVRQGRSQGLTWGQLATALGVTPQAVHKRYGRA